MKRIFLTVFLLFTLVFLFSCAKEESVITTDAGSDFVETETMKTITEEEGFVPQTVPTTTTAAPHSHFFRVVSVTKAGCTYSGVRHLACSCGEKAEETLPALNHDYAVAPCGKAAVCKNCGAEGAVQKHVLQGESCTLCSFTVSAPIYALGCELRFDEGTSSITAKLGKPSEILTEGDLKSLVYAQDPSRLTVIQTDSVGLWGVFTMDPDAFFRIDGERISTSNFSGRKDTQSDASYRDLSSCRIYGFFDTLGTGDCYGLWMRYSECFYDFMTDPSITADYTAQCRLSYYYVNALRARHGLAPLSWSYEAAAVAREYSEKMALENFFYHDNLYGSRLQEKGILWRSCGENISRGYTGALFVSDAYYNCLDHRHNILSASFAHVGMGFALQADSFGPLAVLGAQIFYS